MMMFVVFVKSTSMVHARHANTQAMTVVCVCDSPKDYSSKALLKYPSVGEMRAQLPYGEHRRTGHRGIVMATGEKLIWLIALHCGMDQTRLLEGPVSDVQAECVPCTLLQGGIG